MAVQYYAVFVPAGGTPLTGDGNTATGIVDPFDNTVDAAAFFPIDDWSADVAQTTTIGSQSTGAGAGKITFNPLSIKRTTDRLSPTLFTNAAAGTPFETIDLIAHQPARNAGHAGLPAWRFQLVEIKSIAWSGDDGPPVETITSEYGSLTINCAPQSSSSQPQPPIQTGWNRITNTPI